MRALHSVLLSLSSELVFLIKRLAVFFTGALSTFLALLSGLAYGSSLMLKFSIFKAGGLAVAGAQATLLLHYAASGLQASYTLSHLQLSVVHHLIHLLALPLGLGTSTGASSWALSDVDAFSSTDMEEVMTFAADIFEFLNQEYSILACTLGESHLSTCATGGSLALNQLYRALSSRRFK